MSKSSAYCILICCMLVGCGGGEDFSAPPAQIAQQRAQTQKAAPNEPPSSTVQNAEADVAKTDDSAAPAPEDADGPKDASPSLLSQLSTETPPTDAKKPAAQAADVAKTDTVEGATVNTDKVGADPATTDTPKVEQEQDSSTKAEEFPVAKATSSQKDEGKKGMSFLDSLKAGTDKPKAASTAEQGRRAIARTGRFAVSLPVWLKLKLAMSKRFFFAATPNATRIAASSGERSLGVLSTQVEDLGQEFNFVNTGGTVRANIRSKTEVLVQSVGNLPAAVNSVELIDHGNVVLVGTEDGRLIARSCANLQDWDIYAQDLFAFQDEHRPATRISDTGIVVVRAVSPDRILTVDADSMCRIWKSQDVVHVPIPPLEMTPEQAESPDASVLTATPVAEFRLPESQVLNVVFSRSADMCAIVTADEVVTIIETQDASVVTTITTEGLDDTQPVSVWFESETGRVLIGLADGRIFRKALPKGTPVQGTNENGLEVDYEIVFAPAANDRSGATTALAVTSDVAFLYFGRMDGAVTKFDLPRKQIVSTTRTHSKAVLEMLATKNGILSIGDDRVAHLTDIPQMNSPVVPGVSLAAAKTKQKFDLPKDDSLPTQVTATDQVEGKQDKFTVQRNFNQAIKGAAQEVNSVGVRPPNPKLALYEHQLRVAATDARDAIRQKILSIREGGRTPTDLYATADSAVPVQVGELSTSLDYLSKPIRTVSMSLSDDGKTVAATQYYKQALSRGVGSQPVFSWDLPTQSILRTWKRLPGVLSIDGVWEDHMLIPSPMKAVLNMQSGQLQSDPSVENTTHALSHDRQRMVVGRKGATGQATDAVAMQTISQQQVNVGIEAFEGFVGAVAYSHDGHSVFVSVREKTRVKLLELDSQSLAVINELATEPMSGAWNLKNADRTGVVGATHIIPSPSGRLLVTYGRYETNFQLRIWKKTGDKWPQDAVTVIPLRTAMIDVDSVTESIKFVNDQDNLLGVVTLEGIATIDSRTGDLKDSLPVPDVEGRRPVILLSNDGRYAFSGDADGNVWVSEMRSLERRPRRFVAQAGAITGLATSANGNYLATAGMENRIRVWDVSEFLSGSAKNAKKKPAAVVQ